MLWMYCVIRVAGVLSCVSTDVAFLFYLMSLYLLEFLLLRDSFTDDREVPCPTERSVSDCLRFACDPVVNGSNQSTYVQPARRAL